MGIGLEPKVLEIVINQESKLVRRQRGLLVSQTGFKLTPKCELGLAKFRDIFDNTKTRLDSEILFMEPNWLQHKPQGNMLLLEIVMPPSTIRPTSD